MTQKRIVVFLFLVLFFSFSMAAQSAYAAWSRCRSDPVVILSNGLVLDISATIDTPLYDVEQVDYVLHAPVGVNLIASIRTPSWPTTVETFEYYADNPPGEYHIETIVYTEDSGVAVTANTILLSPLGIHLDHGSASGLDMELLYVFMNVP